MTNEEKQKYIDAISTKMRSIAEECDENLQFEYNVLKLALAALTAQPIKLPKRHSMLWKPGFREGYQSCMAFRADEIIAAIRAAGYQVEGE